MFLIYINDLNGALENCRIRLYADDTVLYQTGENIQVAEHKLQKSIDQFCSWSSANKLTINTKKSKLMVFGSRSRVKKAKNVKIYIQGITLQKVPTFKYLGLILDPTLNYNHHLNSVIGKVLHKMTLLAKMKRYLKKSVALQIYKSMILPYIDYGDIIYNKANSGILDKLQRLQNKCLRICSGFDKRFNTDRAHKLSSVAFLSDRRRSHVLNFMYQRTSRKDLLNSKIIGTRAHDAPLFNTAIPRCKGFKRSVGYSVSMEWNNLPPTTRNIDNYLVFKFKSKKEMLHPLSQIVV